MERLPPFEHDVIGDVYDVVDGPQPRSVQTLLHPTGRLANCDAAHHNGYIAAAQVRVGDLHGGRWLRGVLAPGDLRRGRLQVGARDGSQFPCDAEH